TAPRSASCHVPSSASDGRRPGQASTGTNASSDVAASSSIGSKRVARAVPRRGDWEGRAIDTDTPYRYIQAPTGGTMLDVTLHIEGMSCGHCLNAVNGALNSVPGARVISVQQGRATVQVPSADVTATLVAAVERAGYR